jgi:phage terminase large subunit
MGEVAIETLRAWKNDPVLFVRQNFRVEPDEWQRDYLYAYAHGKNRTAAAACKGPGKTCAMAWAGWHFLSLYPKSKVPCTSITGPNLKDGLWAEFKLWQDRSPYLQQQFEWGTTRIAHRKYRETWFATARQWSKDADPQQQANTLAGIHADYILFLIDECSNIPDGVVAAAEGALTSGKVCRLLMAGNCTKTGGPLYRAVVSDSRFWNVIRITGDPDDPKRSPRINLQEARDQISKYGRDSYIVRVNILGVFPERQADKLLDIGDFEKATERSLPERAFDFEPKIIGVDVARYGDDETIFAPRQGRMVFEMRHFRNLDSVDLADQLARSIEKWNPDMVNIDAGVNGIAVYDILRHRAFGKILRAVNFGGIPMDDVRYLNKRVEMWNTAADWVKGGGCLPKDPMLGEELCDPVYFHNHKQQMCLEEKKDIKARIGRSPDRADAFVLTFATPVRPGVAKDGVGSAQTNREAVGAVATNRNPLGEGRI